MSEETVIRVMLVDDHAIVRKGLREVFEESGEFEVVGEASTGVEAVELAPTFLPDVVIMDVMMEPMSGIEASRRILKILPDTRVVVLTASPSTADVAEAIASGADGYIHKYAGLQLLVDTVRQVAHGEFTVAGDLVKRAFADSRWRDGFSTEMSKSALTLREREILRMFADGNSYATIAEFRGNKPLTIRNAIYNIQNKLRLNSRQELIVWTVRNGLLDDEQGRAGSSGDPAGESARKD